MSTLKDKLTIIQQARDDIRTALTEKGQVVGKDIRDYAQAVSEITTSEDLDEVLTAQEQKLQALEEALNNKGTVPATSGVKLFDTIEHMQQDENPQEGDLAVVYREEIQPVTEESEFDSCIFPNEVVLDEAFTDNVFGSFRSTGGGFFDGMVDMSSSNFRFDGWGESSQVRVQYTSNDGITYTRTDGGEELQEFGTTVKWENMESWNDVIGNFMKIGGHYFDGLYEYTLNNADNTKVRFVPASNCEIDISNRKIIADTTSNYTDIDKDVLIEILNNFAIEKSVGGVTRNNVLNRTFFYLRSDNNIGIIYNVVGSGDNDFVQVLFNTDNSIKGICCNTLPIVSMDYSTATIEEYLVNINNKTYEKVNTSSNRSTINIDGGSRYLYYMPIENISVNSILIKARSWNEYEIFDLEAISSCSIQTTDTIGYESLNVTYKLDRLYNSYIIAKSQLGATPEYVYGKSYYSKNGVGAGTLQDGIVYNNDIKNVYLNLVNIFSNTGLVIENGIKLQDLPYSELPFKLDTSNVVDMGNMFCYCTSLTTIPLLNTSNVTSMYMMFENCNSLVSIPLLDTSKVVNMMWMFEGCTSLTTIPLLDTSKVEYMLGMFGSCSNLNDTSLNNIMRMCINAVNYKIEIPRYV